MQYIVALILAGIFAWVISIIGAGAVERAISAFAALVGGWRPDSWPRGVQEEDRDSPWGARRRSLARGRSAVIDEGAAPVPVTRVRQRPGR